MNRSGEGIIRAGYGSKRHSIKKKEFLMSPHPFTNFEIERYYQNEPRFSGVYSRDNLPEIKGGAYVISMDEHSYIGTHCIALHALNNNVTCFHSFGVEHSRRNPRIYWE